MHAAFSAQALALTLLSSLSTIQAGPSIDVNDASALEKATKAALQNLYNMYDPIEVRQVQASRALSTNLLTSPLQDGGYDQVSEPWWACELV